MSYRLPVARASSFSSDHTQTYLPSSPLSAHNQAFLDEQEVRRQVLEKLELYTQQNKRRGNNIVLKIGTVGLLKEIADIIFEKTTISTLSPHDQYDLYQYVYNCTVTYLTQNNRGHSVMLSTDPLAMRCTHYVHDAYTKDHEVSNPEQDENLDDETLLRRINMLKFPLERIQLAWDLAIEELMELVRLGDRYLKIGLWQQAEIAYQEGFQQLLLLSTSDINAIDGLARLAVLGYGHALFGQGKFIEAAGAFRLGLHFFPTFPTLPFNPLNLYKTTLSNSSTELQPVDRMEDYHKTIQDLEKKIADLEQLISTKKQKNESVDDSLRNLHLLKFVQAFEYHFTGKREESRIIFKELLSVIRNMISVLVTQDNDNDEEPDTIDLTEEIEFFLKPVKIMNQQVEKSTNESSSIEDFSRIDMNDRSLRQLHVWTKRLFDPKKGVEIKNRKWRLRTYENCFICQEAVTYISKNGDISRTDAVDFLQRIMNRYILRHVYDEHMIEDTFLFFNAQLQLIDIVFEQILVESYLMRKTGVKWVKRYAVLFPKALVLFENGPGTRLADIIHFDKGQVVLGLPNSTVTDTTREGDIDCVFNLTVGLDIVGSGGVTTNIFTFSTEKMTEPRSQWIRAFHKIPHIKVQSFDK
jgi:tetratricopeptide (TPR) repeat protein